MESIIIPKSQGRMDRREEIRFTDMRQVLKTVDNIPRPEILAILVCC
jgi:hypothetical protein